MKIRPATRQDADAICAIMNPLIRDTAVTFTNVEWTREKVWDDLDTRGAGFVVAERAGTVVGFASLGPFRTGPGYAHVREHAIHILPAARGQGIGRALMHALEHRARADGIRVLVAGISGANPSAEAFHRQMGFEKSGHMPKVGFKAGQWLDLVLMQKTL